MDGRSIFAETCLVALMGDNKCAYLIFGFLNFRNEENISRKVHELKNLTFPESHYCDAAIKEKKAVVARQRTWDEKCKI